ncbi:MAG: Gfo/Idh/MocA family oxidoreductase [Phycisphaerae bacterium]|nr:Gfo/Idh/MocA family oxidoreductase [Phycisphaerae bacterium]
MTTLSRRGFIKTLTAGVAIPAIVPSRALGLAGTVAPSNRIAMGFIGTGGRMNALFRGFLPQKDVQAIAVADPRDGPRQAAEKKTKVDSKASYRDFRELIARDDIDAVAIASPDHWHVPLSIAAIKSGKDVYCEKPLSNTISEGRILVDTVKRYGAVFQHGTQLHSMATVHQACQLVRNGRIGELKQIVIGSPPGKTAPLPQPEPIPNTIDYDLWQGPAPLRPYNSTVVNRVGWYFLSDYSQSGWIAGFGVHDIDIAQWAIGMGRTGPVEIEGRGVFPKEGLYDTITTYELQFTYPNGAKLLMTDTSRNRHGVTFHGSEGKVYTRYTIETQPKALARAEFSPGDILLEKSPGHQRNFLDCVKSRQEPVTSAEIAHRATSTALLGGIAVKLGRKLRWNPQTEQFINDPQADALLTCAMRPPWRV